MNVYQNMSFGLRLAKTDKKVTATKKSDIKKKKVTKKSTKVKK